MRRTAYLKALEEASKLPESIGELARYFKCFHNPRLETIDRIKMLARVDEKLFHGELVEVLTWKEGTELSVEDKCRCLQSACRDFLEGIGFEQWKDEVTSIRAKIPNGNPDHELGTLPFEHFYQQFRKLTNAKGNDHNTSTKQATSEEDMVNT